MNEEFLSKDFALLERDAGGKLLPREVEIEIKGVKKKIKVIPMARGDWFAMQTKKETTIDEDSAIVEKYCYEPKFTKEEINHMKSYLIVKIASAVLKVSGIREGDETKTLESEIKK